MAFDLTWFVISISSLPLLTSWPETNISPFATISPFFTCGCPLLVIIDVISQLALATMSQGLSLLFNSWLSFCSSASLTKTVAPWVLILIQAILPSLFLRLLEISLQFNLLIFFPNSIPSFEQACIISELDNSSFPVIFINQIIFDKTNSIVIKLKKPNRKKYFFKSLPIISFKLIIFSIFILHL